MTGAGGSSAESAVRKEKSGEHSESALALLSLKGGGAFRV